LAIGHYYKQVAAATAVAATAVAETAASARASKRSTFASVKAFV